MSLKDLIPQPLYGKKIVERFENPKNCGTLCGRKEIPLVTGSNVENGIKITLYLLIDAEDGIIADAKFQAIAPPLIIAATDILCDLILRKNYEVARNLRPESILKALDDDDINLNPILDTLQSATQKAALLDLPKTPLPKENKGSGMPEWHSFSKQQKLAQIEKIIEEEIRPYIEMDEGGIEVQDLINDKELVIAYKGACTSCFSSIGATLNSIQEILQAKLHPDLSVTPDLTNLKL